MVNVIDLRSPACDLFGVRELRCDGDRSEFVQRKVPVEAWSIGWLGVLADEAAGRPLILRIPPATRCPSLSLHFDLVQPPAEIDARELTARGTVVRVGGQVTLTQFVVEGATGAPLVVGSMRNAILPGELAPDATSTVDVDPDGTLAHEPDLGSLLGTVIEEQGDDGVRLSWTPRAAHGNPVGSVHGGVHVAIVDVALNAAIAAGQARRDWTLLGLDVSYHRPIPLGGAPVSVTATVLHAGRTSALAEATVRGAGGKPCTTARATFVQSA